MWGPRWIAKLVNVTPITMVYGTYNYSYWGESKPTNITGGHHLGEIACDSPYIGSTWNLDTPIAAIMKIGSVAVPSTGQQKDNQWVEMSRELLLICRPSALCRHEMWQWHQAFELPSRPPETCPADQLGLYPIHLVKILEILNGYPRSHEKKKRSTATRATERNRNCCACSESIQTYLYKQETIYLDKLD